jgi:sugar phosphate isomerase/epimerase
MMPLQNRRSFIKSTTGLLAAGMSGFGYIENKKYPLLSFSTLGCPDWPIDKIIRFAQDNQYKGIEIRGIQRELNLVKTSAFNSPAKIAETKKMLKGIRTKSIEEAKQFIDLAKTLDCPFIRVFPNNLPKDQEKQATLDLIKDGLRVLGDYAKGSGVTVLMETHGDVVYTADILNIMQDLNHPQTGLVWDIINMWSVTKETPVQVYPQLKPYIKHTHIKDCRMIDGKLKYTLVGRGESPIFQAIDQLRNGGYDAFYSFEWEKLWHPELEEPEIAFSAYVAAMRYIK